jgi:ABC-type oligopeptide transport system substrate-binding subunit
MFVLSACKDRSPIYICQDEEITMDIYEDYPDISAYCQFFDQRGNDIYYSEDMIIDSTIDNQTAGVYELTILVEDTRGRSSEFTFSVTVMDTRIFRDATGRYDFSDAPVDVKTSFLAAAEQYLLDTMNGGIPLYSDASYFLKSNRLDNISTLYIPYIGFREYFTPLTTDDSDIILYDGSQGNAGEYTFRTITNNNLTVINPYRIEDASIESYQKYTTGVLYRYIPSEEHVGYDLVPSLARDFPTPIEPEQNSEGETVSTTWQIPIKEGLVWSYYKDAAPSYVTDHTIDANDFAYGLKAAADEQWYRFINNGSSLVDYAIYIKNASEYIDGTVSWDDVGIDVVDDYTLEVEFIGPMSEESLIDWLLRVPVTPVHQEMVEQLGDNYATSLNTIAYSGPYRFDDYMEDEVIVLTKNTAHPLADTFPHDYITYEILEPEDTASAFNANRLDFASIDAVTARSYNGSNELLLQPGTTIMRLNINGFGTTEEQQKIFPNSTYTPEPLLANDLFKQAMYYTINRNYLTQFMNSGYPSPFYINDTYIIDTMTGIPYRYTEQGQAITMNRFPSVYGYDYETAYELFIDAIEEEIASGHYAPGTEQNPTIIPLDLYYFADSSPQVSMFNLLEDQFELIFRDEENHIYIDVLPRPTDFPDIYYDHVLKGEFDLAIGGLGGSVWNVVGILNIFRSDNKSHFTMNYGFDTSIADIIVEYTDPLTNQIVVEEWSFDGISTVLNGGAFIYKGQEAVIDIVEVLDTTTQSAIIELETLEDAPYMDMTYTVYTYNINTNRYDIVPALERIEVQDFNPVKPGIQFLVEDLEPYIYSSTPSGNTIYQGDYKVQIRYHFTGSDIHYSVTTSWFTTDSYLTLSNKFATNTTFSGNIVLHDDATTESVTSIALYNEETGVEVTTATITLNEWNELLIEELEQGTTYILMITLDSGFIQYITFETSSFSNGLD